ncbi:hypothetical protein [Dyadobacter sp. CY347]|uniref:hypothetical protein n=1 Tax=Dyadobacter sp. CY347 TaxID=2909336 RepID=UPI001F3729F0|nr:hypothetical protein [Dyadobacter sp. CY347]MCF2486540.1 hypothetical protein [Dyadobacter sp. CY347]
MSSSAALFQIMYQNETLFRVGGSVVPEVLEKPIVTEHEPAPVKPEAPQVIAKPIPKTPAIAPVPAPALPAVASFPELQHSILILMDTPKQKEMAASESLFLDNILKAVGHSVEKADVLNYSFLKGPDARKVLSEKKTNFFITFGVPLIKLHLDLLLMPYTPKVVDGVWFLLTDPLHVIEADRNLKKKLWQALQKMFEMY